MEDTTTRTITLTAEELLLVCRLAAGSYAEGVDHALAVALLARPEVRSALEASRRDLARTARSARYGGRPVTLRSIEQRAERSAWSRRRILEVLPTRERVAFLREQAARQIAETPEAAASARGAA